MARIMINDLVGAAIDAALEDFVTDSEEMFIPATLFQLGGSASFGAVNGVPVVEFGFEATTFAFTSVAVPDSWGTMAQEVEWLNLSPAEGSPRLIGYRGSIAVGAPLPLTFVQAATAVTPTAAAEDVPILTTLEGEWSLPQRRVKVGVRRNQSGSADTLNGGIGVAGMWLRRVS